MKHPLLERLGVAHGFAVADPASLPVTRPRQVHGSDVAVARRGALDRDDADAVVSAVDSRLPVRDSCGSDELTRTRPAIGIVTADCVPILACGGPAPDAGGKIVAAIHAGWRGLAAGVIEAGIAAVASRTDRGAPIFAVIGPHIGICCYEVDAAVLDPLRARFGAASTAEATVPSRPGHWRLSLGRIVVTALARGGVAVARQGWFEHSCTFCSVRAGGEYAFASYRRDGDLASRMLHHISPGPTGAPSRGPTATKSA